MRSPTAAYQFFSLAIAACSGSEESDTTSTGSAGDADGTGGQVAASFERVSSAASALVHVSGSVSIDV